MKTLLRIILTVIITTGAISAKAQKKSSVKKVTYQCNFDCESCETKVMKNIPYEKGVTNVLVSYEQKLVIVEYKEAKNSNEGIKQALEELGYEVSIAGKSASFNVKGNCGMCKTKIENAAKSVNGVTSANWNNNTLTITVVFDETKTNLNAIHKAIAESGYDTEKEKADDEVYNNLHSCCKYER